MIKTEKIHLYLKQPVVLRYYFFQNYNVVYKNHTQYILFLFFIFTMEIKLNSIYYGYNLINKCQAKNLSQAVPLHKLATSNSFSRNRSHGLISPRSAQLHVTTVLLCLQAFPVWVTSSERTTHW